MTSLTNAKTVFLDRDGVINIDHGYVANKERFEFVPGILASLGKLTSAGYKLMIVTNQSGIARGYYDEQSFNMLSNWMLKKMRLLGVRITAIYHCPHLDEDHCQCRKPKPGMLLDAISDYSLDPESCWMVGDSERDIVAANKAGITKTILLSPNRANSAARFFTQKADKIKSIILKHDSSKADEL